MVGLRFGSGGVDIIGCMDFDRAARKLTSWVAILAILMGALAPTISHALAPVTGQAWLEVCSTAGIRWVKAEPSDSEQSPAGKSGAHWFDHCPDCSIQADLLALPAGAGGAAVLLPLSFEVPAAFLAAPRTLHAWVSAQPRAPPFFS